MRKKNQDLLDLMNGMTTEQQFFFAKRCSTTAGHIRNIAHGHSPCGEKLAIDIERETEGKIKVEALRPDVDWAYIRGTARRRAAKS